MLGFKKANKVIAYFFWFNTIFIDFCILVKLYNQYLQKHISQIQVFC